MIKTLIETVFVPANDRDHDFRTHKALGNLTLRIPTNPFGIGFGIPWTKPMPGSFLPDILPVKGAMITKMHAVDKMDGCDVIIKIQIDAPFWRLKRVEKAVYDAMAAEHL